MIKPALLAVVLGASACASISPTTEHQVRYVSTLGIQTAVFDVGRAVLTRYSGFPDSGQSNMGGDPFGGDFPVVDCSTPTTRCIEAPGMAFSQPQAVAERGTWRVGRNTFSVIYFSAAHGYRIIRVAREDSPQWRFDYIYDDDLGVTAFVLYDSNTSTFFLDSEVGLLQP